MATNIRPVVQVGLNVADLDGRITAGGHHGGRNWEADYDPKDPQSAVWVHAGTQEIDGLHAIAPRGIVPWQNMELANWTVSYGNWRETIPAITTPRVQMLHFNSVGPGLIGGIYSNNTFRPGVYLRALRLPPPDGETLPAYLVVDFHGEAEAVGYSLLLPFGNLTADGTDVLLPRLYQWEPGEGVEVGVTEPLAERTMIPDTLRAGTTPIVQDIIVEQLDDYLYIMISDQNAPWIIDVGDDPLTRGRVAISATGHNILFALEGIAWGTSVSCRPQKYLPMPEWVQGGADVANYGWTGWRPTGTGIAVTEQVHETGLRMTRPIVTFTTGPTADLRPLIYRVRQFNPPEITVGTSSETTEDPIAFSWSRNNEWRRAYATAEFRDWDDSTVLQPNGYAELRFAWDVGGLAPTPAARITGHLVDPQRSYVGAEFGGLGQPHIRIEDHPSACLADKKFYRHMDSSETNDAADLFEGLLNTWGVDDSYINVAAGIAGAYTVGMGTPRWAAMFDLGHECGAIQALDRIFRDYFGLQWGWNASGYFLRARPVYSGTPDWILDYDQTTDATEIVTRMEVAKGWGELRNYVWVMSDTGTGALARDLPSHVDAAADDYIGDDWWQIERTDDDSAAEYMVQQWLAQRLQYALMVEFETQKSDLEPDNFVQIDTHPNPDIPDNSVFRILDEAGQGRDADCTITYTMGIEEYGA